MRNLNNYSNEYAQHSFEEYQVKYRKRKVIEIINNYPHRRILEIGCGLDPLFLSFQDFEELFIVEPSNLFYENTLELLKNNEYSNSKISVINLMLEDSIELLNNFNFDFVILSGLLHEIEDVPVFLNRIQTLFNKDTVLHINVPNAKSFHRLIAYEMGIIESIYERSESNIRLQQQRVYDLDSLTSLVKNHKYTIIESGSYFIKPFTHKQMFDALNKGVVDLDTIEGFYKISKFFPEFGSEIYINCKL